MGLPHLTHATRRSLTVVRAAADSALVASARAATSTASNASVSLGATGEPFQSMRAKAGSAAALSAWIRCASKTQENSSATSATSRTIFS